MRLGAVRFKARILNGRQDVALGGYTNRKRQKVIIGAWFGFVGIAGTRVRLWRRHVIRAAREFQ